MNAPAPARIGLISNRNSGHNRDQLDKVKRLLAGCDNICHVETGASRDIPAALRQFAEQEIEFLAINGGDGTVSAVLGHALENASFATLPPVVLLPGGTANMNAGDIGARGKLLKAVQRFCRWAECGGDTAGVEHVQRSLMRVQIGARGSPHYGMFLGMGAVVQGTEYAHQEIHSRGLRDDFSVALGTVRTVWGLFRGEPRFHQAIAVKMCFDNAPEHQEHQALIIAVSSLHRLFMGMRPFWGTEPGPLRLTLIQERPHRFLRTFLSIIRGKPNRDATAANGYISHNARQITISMQGSLNLDGEILNSGPDDGYISITASPVVSFIRL
jgi:diacylglycerol kinase family enzyme